MHGHDGASSTPHRSTDPRLSAVTRHLPGRPEHDLDATPPCRNPSPPSTPTDAHGPRRRYLPGMRRTKIVATIGPASREPETLMRMVEAGHGRRTAELLPRHARRARRDRRPRARRGRPRGTPDRDPAGPARPEAAHRPAARRRRRADSRRAADVLLRRRRARGRRARDEHLLGAACPTRSSRARSCTWPTARCACASRRARRRVRGRRRDRGRRRGRLPPGPQHPRPGLLAAGGARGGSAPAAPRRVDRR